MNERVPLAVLLPLRFLVAIILVVEGSQKFAAGWFHGDILQATAQKYLDHHVAFSAFMPLLKTVHAHPKIFGTLVTLAELVIGGSLLFGVCTRAASALGVLLYVAISGISGQHIYPPGNAPLVAAILVTFVLAPPGRMLGVDQRLRARLPPWLV